MPWLRRLLHPVSRLVSLVRNHRPPPGDGAGRTRRTAAQARGCDERHQLRLALLHCIGRGAEGRCLLRDSRQPPLVLQGGGGRQRPMHAGSARSRSAGTGLAGHRSFSGSAACSLITGKPHGRDRGRPTCPAPELRPAAGRGRPVAISPGARRRRFRRDGSGLVRPRWHCRQSARANLDHRPQYGWGSRPDRPDTGARTRPG